LDGQDFSDFMQEMLVMMDNVKNEVIVLRCEEEGYRVCPV
jgi:hypothetical protein